MDFSRTKKRAALLSIGSNTILIFSKFIVGVLTGSVSIISEAIHSLTDLIAAILAYFSVKVSSEPADIEHQYGHGKFEDLSGGIEGALILFAAGYIIFEAIHKVVDGVGGEINTVAGIIVMLVSAIINIVVSSHLFKVAHKTESIALLADAQHLRTDVYTSIGVLFGLILIKVTGMTIFDPLIAMFIALFIIKAGLSLCITSLKNLLDTSLPEEERLIINNIVKNYMPNEVIEIKNLKTRRAGAERLIEFTLTVPANITIKEGHDLCDKIEENLIKDIGNSKITVHLEPCNGECNSCISNQDNTGFCKK